jgi:molecular chaperone DnaK (HSP70)
LLPSFLYLPHSDEFTAADLVLPLATRDGIIAGELARTTGSKTPIRLVSSAKSWLCHPGVDRRSALLPIDAPPEVPRISPFEASVVYLQHLAATWNAAHPNDPISKQEVVLTVPASFDPAARELTAEAAKRAGLENLVLLEEPQAALYAWIANTGTDWRKLLNVGDVILVVDVGGGTTDFSLIAVGQEGGALSLSRVAVGDHILLGGDNMDLALAYRVKQKIERPLGARDSTEATGKTLDSWQLTALTHACRSAKEELLTRDDLEALPIVVPSRGSKLIGGSIRAELTRDEVRELVLDGFFPSVESTARPVFRARVGLTQLGLPYAQDAGVTRHLAAFLGKQAGALEGHDGFARPTAILFNGGVFKANVLRDKVASVLNQWLSAAGAPSARLLPGADLDLACARGAAYYGYVRRGRGVRIRGGTAKSYYIGVESAAPSVPGIDPPIHALCVAPFGMEEGTSAPTPPQELGLVVGEPVRFKFFESSVRRDDMPGTVLERVIAGELESLREIEATLPAEGRVAGEVVPVRLCASVTEVGTLQIEALPRDGTERWKVELDVRVTA